MCSHVQLTRRHGPQLAEELEADLEPGLESLDRPRDRIGPGQRHYLLRMDSGRRQLTSGLLGLEGHTKKGLLVNARAETVHRLPAFRDAFVRRRCLVPAEAFYEWTGARGTRRPVRFRRRDDGLLLLAGLYQEAVDGETGGTHTAYVILTTRANGVIGAVHDRMPVLLEGAEVQEWLEGGVGSPGAAGIDARRLLALLRPAPEDRLVCDDELVPDRRASDGSQDEARTDEDSLPVLPPPRSPRRAAVPAPPAEAAPLPHARQQRTPSRSTLELPLAPPAPAKPDRPPAARRGEQLSLFR